MKRIALLFYVIFLVKQYSFQSTNIFDYVNCPCNRSDNLNVSKVMINCYNAKSKMNASYPIGEAAESIRNRTDFDKTQCVHMFIPGFMTTNSSFTTKVAYCTLPGVKCADGTLPLVITVDLSYYVNGLLIQKLTLIQFYEQAVKYIKSIGLQLAYFIVGLIIELPIELITVLGHSLGAHTAGYMGSYVQELSNEILPKIYGADPAGPCYDSCPEEHLKSGDAEDVLAFHCNAGYLGSTLNMTDWDFYSGNGVNQDECSLNNTQQYNNAAYNFCSHNLCVPIAYTPYSYNTSDWRAVKCNSSAAFLNGSCDNNEFTSARYGSIPASSKGVYFFKPTTNLSCVDSIYEVYYYLGRSFLSKELGIVDSMTGANI